MLPAFLITLREVLEIALIVATLLGIVTKLHQGRGTRSIWLGTAAACVSCLVLLAGCTLFGFNLQKFYSGKIEEYTEGILLTVSALFMTWAVFFLHTYFSRYKVRLLQKVKQEVESVEQAGLFWLVYTVVIREGLEIVLFLASIFVSTQPKALLSGLLLGVSCGLGISFLLFKSAIRMPVRYAFQVSSVLIVLFAAGQLARGVHEFAEVGIIPELWEVTFAIVPGGNTVFGSLLHSLFGISKTMDIVQLVVYGMYIALMVYLLRVKPANTAPAK